MTDRCVIHRHEETEAAVVSALSGRRLRRFRRLLALARRYAVLREEQAELLPLAIPPPRRAVLRLGAVLAARDVVAIPDDVFIMVRGQLQAGLSGAAVPAVGPARRRWEQRRRLVPPLAVGRLPRFFADILGSRLDVLRTLADDDGIIGLPGSPGRATGPVRVLEDPFEPDRLLPGEVLVARLVTAAWLPLLERAAAVVTDGGHVAAHASLLVRELGIPAVLATGDATTRLSNGELVTVDRPLRRGFSAVGAAHAHELSAWFERPPPARASAQQRRARLPEMSRASCGRHRGHVVSDEWRPKVGAAQVCRDAKSPDCAASALGEGWCSVATSTTRHRTPRGHGE